MPATYTSSLRVTLQAPGSNLSTWGAILNTGVFQLVDTAIAGRTSLSLSGSTTLTTANGMADAARSAVLDITGGTGGTITIPPVSKVYQVRNAASGNVVITTGSGRTATVAPANIVTVVCDSTNVDRGADQADVDASLVTAKAYTDAAAFSSASGNLPGQAGNAGKFLQTNGTSPGWTALGSAAFANIGTSAGTVAAGDDGRIVGALQATGNLGDLSNPSTARSNLGLGTAATQNSTAFQAALGFTPVNKAGDTMSGALTNASGFVGPLTGTASLATAGSAGFKVNALTAARMAAGTTTNSGRISWGTSVPGFLDVGEIFLVVAAV
jgi:hypothetical protein